MKNWKRERYEVEEREYDRDLHMLTVIKNNGEEYNIYPDTIKDMQECIEELDAGGGVEDWEDGNGYSISSFLLEDDE